MTKAADSAANIAPGSMPVIVLVTDTAKAMFHTGDYYTKVR